MDSTPRLDEWDRAAQRIRSTDALAELAKRFLAARQDEALGLGPASILPTASRHVWILYWCAARRVDDSIEQGETAPSEWRRRIAAPGRDTLAERCVAELLRSPLLAGLDLGGLLEASLRGIEREDEFKTPQPWKKYEELLLLKSVPTMHVFDALLAPDEDSKVRGEHARAFGISAQVGDDCRDAVRDIEHGRCFVTREELGARSDVAAFVGSPKFVEGRVRTCLEFLTKAETAAKRFRSGDARQRAARLHGFWRGALESGQVRPTDAHLPFRAGGADQESLTSNSTLTAKPR